MLEDRELSGLASFLESSQQGILGTGSADLLPGGQTFEAVGDSQSGDIALELQGADLLSGNFEQLLLAETSSETLPSQEGIDPVTGLDRTSRIVRSNTAGLVLDADGNGRVGALSDGVLIVRYLLGETGELLTRGAVETDASRTEAQEIITYLDGVRDILDVDGNGVAEAPTDGTLIIRDLFGLTGEQLIQDAVAQNATRTTATEIKAYLDSFNNPTPETVPEVTISPANGEEMVNLTRGRLCGLGRT